jgi:endoglucanase
VRILLLVLSGAVAWAVEPTSAIKLDQVGYLPDAPKLAMVVAGTPGQVFFLHRAADDETVYSGALGAPVDDANSGDRVQVADFSAFSTPGRYYLEVPEAGRSYAFDIGRTAYGRAYYLAMRSYYGQRCGTAVDLGPEFPQYRHAECHRNGAWHASSGKQGVRLSQYGWHDAGDYGRYVVNSGLSTGTLLWTWELFGERVMRISLNIPESGNGTPDLLNEVRWNLQWMLSMQDDDGGVWHKQTSENFPGFILPERDNSTSYAIGTGTDPYKSSCATGDFAAVMAVAQRLYERFDAGFAARAGDAAARAWTWLGTHPNVVFRNPANVVTGEYGDGDCSDERLWAAAELWRSTGEEQYHTYFLANYQRYLGSVGPPSWPFVAPMALWTYALSRRDGAHADAVESIRQASVAAANQVAERTAANAYRIAMTSGDFTWGSNGQAANYSLLLLVANALEPNRRWVEAALENLHYLLGRNTFSVSWVTWVGSNWFKNPHHRPSGADGVVEPWPGLLSGGPDKYRDDSVLQSLPSNLPPMRVWADILGSYASNEIAINWNATLVFALAGALPEPNPRRAAPRPGWGKTR